MQKIINIFSFGVLSFILGAIAGAIIWVILKIMNLGIELIWEIIPENFGLNDLLIYNMIICIIGGVLIGIVQKEYGPLPEDFQQVMGKIKKEKRYSYNNLHIITICALLPLIFGGTLGPEAGLSGVIAGLCYFVGDRLKYKQEQVSALMETGVAATLGAIFGSPFFGIAHNIEPDDKSEKFGEKLGGKKTRIYVYIMGVLGAMLVMRLFKSFFGGEAGFPRFERYFGFGIEEWKWIIPLIIVGIILGLIYLCFHKFSVWIANKLKEYKIISAVLAGIVLAIVGYFFPLAMFSGEHDTWTLMEEWETMGVSALIIIAIIKLFMVNICINLGWRGGHIFPIIFSGVAAGYAFAQICGMDGTYAVALVCGGVYAYVSRKPIAAIVVLLLCFPLTYIIPLVISCFAASKIPQPKFLVHNE